MAVAARLEPPDEDGDTAVVAAGTLTSDCWAWRYVTDRHSHALRCPSGALSGLDLG